MQQTITKHRILFLLVVFMLLPATVFAAAAAISSWTAYNSGTPVFKVDLYAIDQSNLPAVTYKYAVTDIYPGSGQADPGQSHWTLGIGQCVANLVSPTAGAYTTPIDPAVCGAGLPYASCTSENYQVVLGQDPTTGVEGIKFEGGMEDGETHLFHLTVSSETGWGFRDVAVKAGTWSVVGTMKVPLCEPTAVTMAAPSAASHSNTAFFGVAAAMMVMGVLSVGVLRKK
jgi:hypothetical protein